MRRVRGTQLTYVSSLRRLNPLLWGAHYAYERAASRLSERSTSLVGMRQDLVWISHGDKTAGAMPECHPSERHFRRFDAALGGENDLFRHSI